ncbi:MULTISPECIES: alpha/beta fold hydrolase [Mycobacterium]|uniref:AB hydrolase-1 domain-containing protein n=1 Tax=Mycobacterium paragordonae TaxID=1389713 RepID=A0ABQ1CG96_9MYCO|nr:MULTISPECIES: alpha/beta hydrolase [Mycobacterium]GFG83163.1 hypothetical protein MPRG_64390 [Mycobacterium paragordonae]
MRVVASDGVQLRVADAGERGAPRTVVFLHGFCLSGASWMGHGDALLRFYGSGLRVISYDHRGHGFSHGGSAASYRIERLAEDLAEILQTLCVRGEVTLVGHSMGAMVALTYMGRLYQPVVPTGLVLVGAAAGRLRQRGLGRALAVPGLRLLCRVGRRTPVGALRMLAQPLCVGLSQVRWAQTAGGGGALAQVVAHALADTSVSTIFGFLPALSDYDQYPMLGRVRARTVVISGESDVLTPPAHGLEVAAGIAGASHVCVPGAGHMLPQLAFGVVQSAIRLVLADQWCPETNSGVAGE